MKSVCIIAAVNTINKLHNSLNRFEIHTSMLAVISLKAESASDCFSASNLLCSAAFFFRSSTSSFASFNFVTPA